MSNRTESPISVEEFLKKKEEQFRRDKENIIRIKDIGRKTFLHLKREAWTFMPASNMPEYKIFVVERFRKSETFRENLAYPDSWEKDAVEYRIGYFIVGRIGRAKNRWTWGQYCPIIPATDLQKLIKKAELEGTILNSDK